MGAPMRSKVCRWSGVGVVSLSTGWPAMRMVAWFGHQQIFRHASGAANRRGERHGPPRPTQAEPDNLRTFTAEIDTLTQHAESAVWSISRIPFRALALPRWWHSVTGLSGLRWVSA
jgi:hypothetical protein